jgi:hypothetical protein
MTEMYYFSDGSKYDSYSEQKWLVFLSESIRVTVTLLLAVYRQSARLGAKPLEA